MKKLLVTGLAIALFLLVALSLRGLTAQQRQDGIWQKVPPHSSRGIWSVDHRERGSAAQAGTRVATFESGRPLWQRLAPEDQRLEVVDFSGVPFAGGADDPVRELEAHTRRAEVVIIARAAVMRSQFTPNQDWITSQIDLEVEEILKQGSRANDLRVGQRLSLPVDGGEIVVNGKQIVARPRWADIPHQGGRYLYFLFWDQNQLRSFPATQTFELTDGLIRRLQRGARWGIDRDGISPEAASEIIRAASSPDNSRMNQFH